MVDVLVNFFFIGMVSFISIMMWEKMGRRIFIEKNLEEGTIRRRTTMIYLLSELVLIAMFTAIISLT